MKDGSQLWVIHRNGTIQEGGKNNPPRTWDKDTGLNNNPLKNKKPLKKKSKGKIK